jgi:glycosyltransferase involved in cell wall biosynthesis
VKGGGIATSGFRVLGIAIWHPLVTLRGFAAVLQLARGASESLLFLAYLAEALLVGAWMRKRGLAHLHVHFAGPVASVGLITAKAWRVPWSVTLHGPDEFFDESRFLLREKLLCASRVFAISDFAASQILRIAPEARGRLVVSRLGIDLQRLEEIRETAGEMAGRPFCFVCTARLVPIKGHRVLLEAFAQICGAIEDGGAKPKLELIGDGPERAHLTELATQLGIGDSVTLLGALSQDETLRRMAGGDGFVLASFGEGLPVSLMEAMALGIPCVSTYIAGIPELIVNGENGLLVPAGNVEELAQAMGRLMRDEVLCNELTRKARATVKREYDLERNLAGLAAQMRTLSANSATNTDGAGL